ncbi:MAG: PAS domain-containing protein [Ignavibacteriales bacterium]|nr:PAS domain-containing protein [Ignavibacteriales bacterium]
MRHIEDDRARRIAELERVKSAIDAEIERTRLYGEVELRERAVSEALNDPLFFELADAAPLIFFALDRNLRFIYANRAFVAESRFALEDIVGGYSLDVFPEIEHTEIHRLIVSTVEGESTRTARARYRWGERDEIVEMTAAPTTWGGAFFARIVTEEAKAQSIQKALVEFEFLGAVVFQDERIPFVNAAAERMLGRRREEVTRWSKKEATQMIYPDDLPYFRDRVQPAITAANAHKRTTHDALEFRVQKPDGTPLWVNAYVAPVEYDGKLAALGVFVDATDRKRAEAEALESREELRRLNAHLQNAREEERADLARVVHDDLGMMIASLNMNVATVRRDLNNQEAVAAVDKDLEDIAKVMAGVVEKTRALIDDLRPADIDELGLLPALEALVERMNERSETRFEFAANVDEAELGAEAKIVVYRIAQEALLNCLRHARAERASLIVRRENGGFAIEIADDGVGFDPDKATDGASFGLLAMRERAAAVGGKLDVNAEPGRGARLTLVVPDAAATV